MPVIAPSKAAEVAEYLKEAAANRSTIQIAGNGSKSLWGGPIQAAQQIFSTTGLSDLIEYERNDLTVSVGAGMPFARLQQTLAVNGQMIALDPPYASAATVGGVVAANSFGPMKRRYGTARDLVIGMSFATLDGKVVSSGGRVVKNVAGLDMAKLLIGSFGTLGVIVSVNLRVHPLEERRVTFLFSYADIQDALSKQQEVLQSPLRPIAMEFLSPEAAVRVGLSGYTLAIRAAGSRSVLARYAKELKDSEGMMGSGEVSLWERLQEFAPDFLAENEQGVVVRIVAPAAEMQNLMRWTEAPVVSRSGTGLSYVYFRSYTEYEAAMKRQAIPHQWQARLEAAPRNTWLNEHEGPSSADRVGDCTFATMKRVKALFDPNALLNPLRLYGRI